MATHGISVLGAATLPDTSGNVYFEPAAVNFQANDRYPGLVAVFKDTATRDKLGFAFHVPPDYASSPVIRIIWATTATSGNARWETDYTAIADGESGDPSSDQESVGSTVAAPGTARLLKYTDLALTGGNFAAGDTVQGVIARDGAEAGPADTIAASLYVYDVQFRYADV